ncbi:MAG: hypothetical protein K2X27_20070, partial [Candidatus Obscuribacterales bacterium]|nr:hypothetical protein [Candidatus Obscuribacterales bacterium]
KALSPKQRRELDGKIIDYKSKLRRYYLLSIEAADRRLQEMSGKKLASAERERLDELDNFAYNADLLIGDSYDADSNFEFARRHYLAAAKRKKGDYELLAPAGRAAAHACEKMRQLSQAIRDYEDLALPAKGLKLSEPVLDEAAKSELELAELLYCMHRLEESRQYYLLAQKHAEATNNPTHYALATEALANFEKSLPAKIKLYDKAIAAVADQSPLKIASREPFCQAYLKAARFFEKLDPQKAVRYYQDAIESAIATRSDVSILLAEACSFANERRDFRAIKNFLDPRHQILISSGTNQAESSEGYYALAVGAFLQGNYSEALRFINSSLNEYDLGHTHQRAYIIQGRAYLKLGQEQNALRSFERAHVDKLEFGDALRRKFILDGINEYKHLLLEKGLQLPGD